MRLFEQRSEGLHDLLGLAGHNVASQQAALLEEIGDGLRVGVDHSLRTQLSRHRHCISRVKKKTKSDWGSPKPLTDDTRKSVAPQYLLPYE